ncbi:hypothetical protein G7Y89_g13759 [Cudoniella acicularis]|uniref:PhoD-like phosphatase metallophosphatase domain-containing protein n=1 Tax=Cudoniella acicularis TaxID=354080 RepID=A0A8H4R8X3_9HELO|nr:hypothetical protein G7Y89_g13759 [Cudoniella acicularis]
MLQFLSILALVTTTWASFASNLNYRSPSHHHPSLGVSIRKVAARNTPSAAWNSSQLNFIRGIASGDPCDTSVILWTRATPSLDDDHSNITVSRYIPLYSHETEEYVRASKAPVCVTYKVTTDSALKCVVDRGTVYTSSGQWYSNICFFPVLRKSRGVLISSRNLHSNYRKRLATYRTDLDLLLSHQKFPWIPVWDDHEVADNTWRAGSSELNNTEASFIQHGGVSVDQRKMNAVRVYFKWMPIRQVEMDDNFRIWRNFEIGDLMDLIMFDTRQYDRGITDLYWNTNYIHEISNDAGRTLMGSRQENWFYNRLIESSKRSAAWRVISNQIVFSHISESIAYSIENPLDYDAWGGYWSNRNRTLATLYDNNITNTIFLARDSIEFARSAVSSPCPYGQNILLHNANNYSSLLVAANRELQWQDLYYQGCYEISVDYDTVNASFGMPTIATRNGYEISLANFIVLNGANKLTRTNGAVAGGVVERGSVKFGTIMSTNATNDTATGQYFISNFTPDTA